MGKPAKARPKRALKVLTAGGKAPSSKERDRVQSLAGWPMIFTRKGWKPHGRDSSRLARFTTARHRGTRGAPLLASRGGIMLRTVH